MSGSNTYVMPNREFLFRNCVQHDCRWHAVSIFVELRAARTISFGYECVACAKKCDKLHDAQLKYVIKLRDNEGISMSFCLQEHRM